ncbi:MAG: efflux RND transporter periplasmic adaptor subunit [Alphaproteobacteria bacterium]|nr:efflux RND transporter periplasmic adaptor subunit [Alphaproteobacteria bacterium]
MSLSKQTKILAAMGLAVVAVVAAYIAFSGDGGDAAVSARARMDAPAPVVVEPVRYASNAALVEAVGTGVAIRAVTLHPEATGRVVEMHFKAGQRVEAGDALIRLDDEDEQLAVDLARVRLDEARQNLTRYEKVAPTGAVSTSEVDRARSALAAVQVERAQAELALRKQTLVAPFSGVVGIPEVEVGDWVTEAITITTLDDRSTLLIDFEVPESLAVGATIGGEVWATTWALPGQRFLGNIDAVGSRIDPQTRTLRVRGRFPNGDDLLRTGMSFTIRMPLQGERFPSVPSIAVQWDREGAYVWRVEDGAAHRVEVDVLKREEQWILVDAPLEKGDRIVVEGVQRLRPGRPVEVTGEAAISAVGAHRGE